MSVNLKKLLSLALALVMVLSLGTAALASSEPSAEPAGDASAEPAAEVDEWGEFEIIDDGFGNLTANFPSVYPSEYLTIEDDETIHAKVEAILKTLTEDEKLKMLSGDGAVGTLTYDSDRPFTTGYWKGCARVGVPVVTMYDGPMGIRMNAGLETTRPISEIGITAAFDTQAAYDYGTIYGTENRATGGNNQLGSQVDLLYDLTRGRGKDMFGEDWFLAGTMSGAATKGMEDNNTMSCLKHMLNCGDVDEQTLHETYLSVYRENFVNGGASSVMTGYDPTNGVSACADYYVIEDVVRKMYGYEGIVLTDWGGNYQFTVPNGVTMETPAGSYNTAANIRAALDEGTLTWDDIDRLVGFNLTALGQVGYLGLVTISRDGTVAVDYDPPVDIVTPEILTGEERTALLDANSEIAIRTAEYGAVLVKNEDNTLPLADSGSVAMIGLGSTYLVAGSHGENAFGYLKDLAISPTDGLIAKLPNADIKNYVAQDIVGEAVPAEYFYLDEQGAAAGVSRTGTDGDGKAVDATDPALNYVTNSDNYYNAADGTAFPFGEQGVSYTMTTWLEAPETGTYTLKLEGIAAAITGTIEINGETYGIVAAGGSQGTGQFATSGLVTNDTGLDIPSASGEPVGEVLDAASGEDSEEPAAEASGEPSEEPSDEPSEEPAGDASGEASGDASGTTTTSVTRSASFNLIAGKRYKVTVTVDASLNADRGYLAGTKDTQVRLAWITPSQEESNYADAVEAAKTADTSVVFLHALSSLSIPADQTALLDEVAANAHANGHKVVAVITDGLLPNITGFVDECDAVLMIWQPGQGGGTVVGDILSGAYNPSGKLPVTWPSNYGDTNTQLHVKGRTVKANGPSSGNTIALTEGIFIGYKWYDGAGKQDSVLYDFGYGLSYTTFKYEFVGVKENPTGADDIGYDVTVKVTNTGSVAGSAVPQIYIAGAQVDGGIYTPQDVSDNWHYTDYDGDGVDDYLPQVDGIQQVPFQLAGYAHTDVIEPGQSVEVTIHIGQRLFSYWDTSIADDALYERSDGTLDKYTVISGERTLYVAQSSDDLGDAFTVTVP